MLSKILNLYARIGVPLLLVFWLMITALLFLFHFIGIIQSQTIPIAFLLSFFTGIIFILWDKRRKSPNKNTRKDQNNTLNLPTISKRTYIILNIIFILGCAAAVLMLQIYNERPTIYFILCSLLAVILAVTILFSPKSVSSVFHFIRIGIFSLLTTFSFFKIYYWIGVDTWAHAVWNILVADLGTVYVTLGKEVDYPIQHVAVAIAQILPNVDVRIASLIAVALPSLLISAIIYSILKPHIDKRLAAIAFFLANTAAYLITWRILSQTTSYGIMVICILLYLYYKILFNSENKGSYKFVGLFLIMVITLGLSHQFSAFMFLFIILGGFIASIIYKRVFITTELKLLLSSGLILFFTWLIASFGFIQMIQIIRSNIMYTSDTLETSINVPASYVNLMPPTEIASILSTPTNLVYIILLPILYFSIKYTLSSKKETIIIHSLAWTYGLLFSAYFVNAFLGGGMAHRFQPILDIFTVICIAYLAYYILKNIDCTHKKKMTAVCICLCIIIGAFCMVNLTYREIAPDNPVWVQGKVIQSGISYSDLTGFQTLSDSISDNDATIYIEGNNLLGIPLYTVRLHLYDTMNVIPNIKILRHNIVWDSVFDISDGYIILRDDLKTTPAQTFFKIIGKTYSQTVMVDEKTLSHVTDHYNLIYANNGITINSAAM